MEFEIPFMHISELFGNGGTLQQPCTMSILRNVCDFVEKCPKKLLEKIFFYVVETWNTDYYRIILNVP